VVPVPEDKVDNDDEDDEDDKSPDEFPEEEGIENGKEIPGAPLPIIICVDIGCGFIMIMFISMADMIIVDRSLLLPPLVFKLLLSCCFCCCCEGAFWDGKL
jgi:hypothetical protein